MAERGVTLAAETRRLSNPWWVRVTLIFVASRVVTTIILLWFAARQAQNAWTGARPGYADFAAIWDGHWYYIVAAVGYPTTLPMTVDGHVGENAWAFMPAYPALVRAGMSLTGLDFGVVAVVVSVIFALGAALVFYRLMALVLPRTAVMFSVVLFCFAPLSPILQVAYAESMHLFLLLLALYLLLRRNYWMLIPIVAVLSLTRPSGLAFALTMLLHVGWRWWMQRPGTTARQEFPRRERIAAVVVGLFSALMGVAWPLVAWALTGSFTAYTDTELAWRGPYIGYGGLIPFSAWIKAAGFWAPWLGIPQWLIIAILALVVAAVFVALFTPAVRRLGVDLRFWLASYVLYLLAVFFPQSSIVRLLVPLAPALGVFALPRSKVYRLALVVACIVGQIVWVWGWWWVDGYDWTPP